MLRKIFQCSILLLIQLSNLRADTMIHADPITIVETIPVHTDFQAVGAPTFSSLLKLVESAKESLDISAMYWNLKATSDYFTNKELRDLGADTGAKLYESFLSACSRGVKIRILGAKNFGDSSSSHEVLEMQKQFPDCITFRQWDGKKWYDGG